MFPRLILGIVLIIGTLVLSFMGAEHWLNLQMSKSLNISEQTVIEIEQGSNLNRLCGRLEGQGIIKDAWPIKLYARLKNQQKVIAGEYRLQPGDTARQLLKKITTGDIVEYKLSFPEGLAYKQWLEILRSAPKLLQTNTIDIQTLGIDIQHPEGWFFPDTYYFHKGEKDTDILLRAYRRADVILEQEWQQRASGLPYKTAYEALIMASIIEKETGVASERKAIAGVFVRRLQKGMKLQTDPTVIYGLGSRYTGNITKKHLRQPSAYNTYIIKGLPPTPIAMPGRDAIHAALHPEEGGSLYFVAKGDGSHQFSDTLAEHNRAVNHYQLRRKSNYQSSPSQ